MKKYILALLTASNIAHGAAHGADDLDALIRAHLPHHVAHPTLQAEIEVNIHPFLQPLIIANAGAILDGREEEDISGFIRTIAFLQDGIVGGITPAFITLTKGMSLTEFRAAAHVLSAIAVDDPGLINAMATAIPAHATAAQRVTLIPNLAANPQATWAAEIARVVPAAAPAFGGAGLGALAPAFGGAGLRAVAPAFGGAEKPAAMPAPKAAAPVIDAAEKATYARGKNIHADDRVNETNVGAFEFFKVLAPFADQVRVCAYSEENRKYEYAQLLDLEAYIRNAYVDEAIASLTGVSREQAAITRDAALWTLFGPHIPMFILETPRRDLTRYNNNDFGPLLGEGLKLFEIADADLAMAALWWFINNVNTPRGYALPPQPATARRTPEQVRQGLRIDLVRALQSCIDTPLDVIPQISGNSRVCPDGKGQRLVQILRGILPEVGAEAGTTEPLTLGQVNDTLGNYGTALPDILRVRGEKLKRNEIKNPRTGAIIAVEEQPTRLQYLRHADEFLSKLFIKPEEYLEFRKRFLQELEGFLAADDDLALITKEDVTELTPEELAEGRNIRAWDEARETATPTVVPEAILATARAHTTTAKAVFNRSDFITLWNDTFKPLSPTGKQLAARAIPGGAGAVGGAGVVHGHVDGRAAGHVAAVMGGADARADAAARARRLFMDGILGGFGGADAVPGHVDGGAAGHVGAAMGGAGARGGAGVLDHRAEALARFNRRGRAWLGFHDVALAAAIFGREGVGGFGGAGAVPGHVDGGAAGHVGAAIGGAGARGAAGEVAPMAEAVVRAMPMGDAAEVHAGPAMVGAGAAAAMPVYEDPRMALAHGRYRIDHLPEAFRNVAREYLPKLRVPLSEHDFADRIRGYLEAYPDTTPASLAMHMRFW